MKLRLSVLLVIPVFLLISTTVFAQQKDMSLPDLPGKIAFIGTDFNVYATEFASQTGHQLTSDASATHRYQWVTWSHNGQLAYFCCDLQFATDPETGAYVSIDGTTPGEPRFTGRGEAIIYAGWSPGLCLGGTGCDVLAMLINDISGGALRVDLAAEDADEPEINTIAFGSPFYFNWSPGGDRIVFHRGGSTIDIYDVNQAEVLEDAALRSSGAFQAPAWSPVDDRILFAVPGDENGTSDLVISSGDNLTTLREGIQGGLSFLWSPDGNYIAYRILNDNRYSEIFVVDAVSGETIAQSNLDGTLSFFWSPDSNRLAILTLATEGGTFNAGTGSEMTAISQPVQNITGVTWNVLDVQQSQVTTYNTFIPTSDMVYLMAYFDQFAHSHQLWSPDSSHLVYSEMIENNSEFQGVVTILDVRQPDSVPLTIAHGSFAVWSFD